MSTILEQNQYALDRSSRRTWQKRPLTGTQDLHHDYDALSQVTGSARGSLNLDTTAISAIPAAEENWNYDPTGNWRGYQREVNGGLLVNQRRVHDRGNRMTQIENSDYPIILDRAGRIRQSAPDASGAWGGKLELEWDAWSRITGVTSNGMYLGAYAYDGLHRRMSRFVQATGVTWHSYYSDAWRPLEERKNAETTPNLSYLWGARHRDDLVRRDRAVGGTTLNETRYVLMDYFNPSAITDESGEVKERYAFSAFGVRSILNPDYTPRTTSESAFEFAFQGQFLDTESGLYNYGYRYYSPYLGRWTCKDPIGEKGGVNLYAISANQVLNKVDLLGLSDSVAPSPNVPSDYEYPNEPRSDPFDPDSQPETVGTSTWKCEVSFKVTGQDQDPFCPDTYVGTGTGNPVDSACETAKRNAEAKVSEIGKCCKLGEELGRSAEKITTPNRFPGGLRLV